VAVAQQDAAGGSGPGGRAGRRGWPGAPRRLAEPGFVVDFAGLDPFGRFLAETLDHRDLTEVLPVPPTSERLAQYLYGWCTASLGLPAAVIVEAVRVSETASTWRGRKFRLGAAGRLAGCG